MLHLNLESNRCACADVEESSLTASPPALQFKVSVFKFPVFKILLRLGTFFFFIFCESFALPSDPVWSLVYP